MSRLREYRLYLRSALVGVVGWVIVRGWLEVGVGMGPEPGEGFVTPVAALLAIGVGGVLARVDREISREGVLLENLGLRRNGAVALVVAVGFVGEVAIRVLGARG